MLNAVIDLSHHNTISSFEKIRAAGILAIIHKATQGGRYVDPTFNDHMQQARAAGLLTGAYHFGVGGDPIGQADHLVEIAGKNTLLVLDLEPNTQGSSMTLAEAELFIHHIKELTGRYPGLYSGHTIKEMLQSAGISKPEQTELSKCWFWLAQYGSTPLWPKIWSKWTLWQYTDGAIGPEPHTVDGVGRCDREQFNGGEVELRSLFAPAV